MTQKSTVIASSRRGTPDLPGSPDSARPVADYSPAGLLRAIARRVFPYLLVYAMTRISIAAPGPRRTLNASLVVAIGGGRRSVGSDNRARRLHPFSRKGYRELGLEGLPRSSARRSQGRVPSSAAFPRLQLPEQRTGTPRSNAPCQTRHKRRRGTPRATPDRWSDSRGRPKVGVRPTTYLCSSPVLSDAYRRSARSRRCSRSIGSLLSPDRADRAKRGSP
jgi:hypothetical protein